ncbi:SPFH/Band 7/PHB domain protein [Bacteroides fluxus YIT 12057]|uniref:SPFH/Band 7/PHB domain protein n=2 Tax=Bacteroides fluxus TaxID=626930 RepID=F3PYB5_9BACE|nr:SPFH/Band 7/PHB domain protein [Bacteroides fluxus YIT 12057]
MISIKTMCMEAKELDFKGFKVNGFLALFFHLVVLTAVIIFGFITCVPTLVLSVFLTVVWLILFAGYMQLEPNEARAMVFFGKYKGTFKETGFFWVNPFLDKKKLSLRARNLDINPIKVNDKIGNPILIGLVLVWKLKDTYKAMFEIDAQTMADSAATPRNANQVSVGNAVASRMNAFENFVKIQSDAALRQVAGQYAYDDNETNTDEMTLRSGGEEINEQLEQKLNERLAMAGMEVVEARINYLAYAPEIAAVMLRRQQASAIISAREKIVEGAVSMVKMALHKLSEEEIVELDEEKKAAMVSNLLVVLCADEAAQPVVNTGTLNH